jgi:pilus assembly protein CpaF
LLLTLSSGVKGFTTIHAGSARQALTRLRFVCQLSDTANEVPMAALNSLVSEAVDLVVFCRRTPDGPQVAEVITVEDLAAGPEATHFTVTEVFARRGATSELEWTGNLPARAARAFADAGLDLQTVIDHPESSGWEAF